MVNQQTVEINQLDINEARWFAVYTNYKREKLVKQMLDQKGIECYLPIRKVVKQWSKKRRTMELPLISCYIFVKIVKHEYISVLETEYVLKFIKFAKDLIAIPEEEILIIRNLLQDDIEFEIEAKPSLLEGDTVEIISGSLMGVQGKFISIKGKNRVLITLSHIQHTFQISVEKHLLKKV